MNREALLEALVSFPGRLGGAARTVDPSHVPDGEWGPAEVVRHLIAVEIEVHQSRLREIAETSDPHWLWAEPGPWPGEPDLTLDRLVDRFAGLRAATLGTVDALDDVGWSRTGTHATLGVLDVAGLLRNAVDHDLTHLADLSKR